MAKGLSNLKRFIKRAPARTSPSWSSYTESSGRVSPEEREQTKQQHDEDKHTSTSSKTDVAPSNPIVEIKHYYEQVSSNADLSADDILDGILKDLNIKRISNEAKELDTLSEFTGGSAKSIVTASDNTGGSAKSIVDEVLDDVYRECDNEEMSDEGAVTGSKRQSSMDARVAVVFSVAEEIRKKRGTPPPLPVDEIRKKRGTTPPLPVDEILKERGTTPPPPVDESRKKRGTTPPPPIDSDGSPGSNTSCAAVIETARASNNKDMKSNDSTFRPPIDPKVSPDVPSFDTGDDSMNKDTMDSGDTYGSTYDEDDNTIDTDGTGLIDYSSVSNGGARAPGPPTTNKATMNKDVITAHPGVPSNLAVRAMYCTPVLGNPDDIIIKVEASTVSFNDCLLRSGIGIEKATFPFVPGCELTGTISSLGSAAQNGGYRVGDRVVAMTRRGGCNTKYAKFSSLNVAPVSSTTIEAANLVCLVHVYMTAYQALRLGKKDGTPLTDANVLITDGFSPLGQAATQLARLEGASVWVTTNDNSEDEHMMTLGAKCLRMNPSHWLHKVRGKMDVVIDNTCIDSYEPSWQALNTTGVLICTGMTSIHNFKDDMSGMCGCNAIGDVRDYKAKWASLKAKYIMSKTKFFDLWESFQKDPRQYRQEFKYLCYLVETGMIKPNIADRISLEEVPEAHRRIETGKVNGTIVCQL